MDNTLDDVCSLIKVKDACMKKKIIVENFLNF